MRVHLRILLLPLLLLASVARAELVVEGVTDELAGNVRSYVSLAEEPCDAESWLVQRRFRAIAAEVGTALQPFGFYDPVIETTLEQTTDCWRALVRIDPGKPVTLRNVAIAVEAAPADRENFADLIAAPVLTQGSRLRDADYESLKESLQIRAAERGYVEAGFLENVIDVWPEEHAADLALKFASGPRYEFGEIVLEQSVLDENLVRRFLDFEAGMPYDNRLLTKAYNDLSRSGYFSRIELMPEFERASNQQLPVSIVLEPADRIEYTVGFGFSTDTGPRARAGFQNRRVNNRGHRLQTDLSVSTILQGLSAEYRKPLTDPRTEWLSYTSALSSENTDSSESDTARVGVRRTKQIKPEWMRTLSLDLSYDRYNIGGAASSSSPGIAGHYLRPQTCRPRCIPDTGAPADARAARCRICSRLRHIVYANDRGCAVRALAVRRQSSVGARYRWSDGAVGVLGTAAFGPLLRWRR